MSASNVIPQGDYVSPGMKLVNFDAYFSTIRAVDPHTVADPWLRSTVPHFCYVDDRLPALNLLSRDEAHVIHSAALQFRGKSALQVGSRLCWSAFHLAAAGLDLDVHDSDLARPEYHAAFSEPLAAAGLSSRVRLFAEKFGQSGQSAPSQHDRPTSLFFFDPPQSLDSLADSVAACERVAGQDAMMIFNNLVVPAIASSWQSLAKRGWNLKAYQTRQMLGLAWRGHVQPPEHWPDPSLLWSLPTHLRGVPISGWDAGLYAEHIPREFFGLVDAVRPFTLLSERRLATLYILVRHLCLADLPGNIVECGTYKGGAAALMAKTIQLYSRHPRRVFCCDTFEGMPDPDAVDRHRGIPANATGYGAGTLKAPITENLTEICRRLQVGDLVTPIKGLFTDTLPRHKSDFGPITLLHADADWYSSTMDIFRLLYNQVIENGFIQIDDYGHWEGCKKAIHDFELERGVRFFLNPIDETGVWMRKST